MEKMELVLEAVYHKYKSTILEEAASQEDAQRYTVVVTEAAAAVEAIQEGIGEEVKEHFKKHKGKYLAAGTLAALGGLGYAAHKGKLGGTAENVVNSGIDKIKNLVGSKNAAEKMEKMSHKAKTGPDYAAMEKDGTTTAKGMEYIKKLNETKPSKSFYNPLGNYNINDSHGLGSNR